LSLKERLNPVRIKEKRHLYNKKRTEPRKITIAEAEGALSMDGCAKITADFERGERTDEARGSKGRKSRGGGDYIEAIKRERGERCFLLGVRVAGDESRSRK